MSPPLLNYNGRQPAHTSCETALPEVRIFPRLGEIGHGENLRRPVAITLGEPHLIAPQKRLRQQPDVSPRVSLVQSSRGVMTSLRAAYNIETPIDLIYDINALARLVLHVGERREQVEDALRAMRFVLELEFILMPVMGHMACDQRLSRELGS